MTAGYAISFPFLAIYLSTHRGVPMAWVGAFLAVSMLVASAAQFIGGEVSDAIGRRKVMVFSLALRSVLVAVIAWIVYSGTGLWAILVVHPLGMFIGSFFHPAARSWVADFVGPSRRLKAYGFLRMGNNAGWALGPALGGLLAEGSYALLFVVTAGVYAVCTVIVALSIKDVPGAASGKFSTPRLSDGVAILRNRQFLRFCVFSFTMCAVMSQLVVSSSLYSKEYLGLSETDIGLLFSINGLMVVALQYFVTRVLQRHCLTTGLAAGALFYAAGYLALGFAPAFWAAGMAMVVVTLGEMAVSPGLQALGANMAPRGEKGRYLGVQGVFQQVGSAAGIFVGSNAIGLISPMFQQGPWFMVALVAIVSSLGFLSLGRRLTPEQDGLRNPEAPASPVESPEIVSG
ncbi:MAG: MFS transporter [Verrucomicrobia bacterium]|nr:MFS transporter [Verrucomicrobiota bacterium]